MHSITIKSEQELGKVVEFVRPFTEKNKVVAFYGPMGVGKTTFIKALCKALGVVDIVNSPTFSIVNEYSTKDDGVIYHFDFYRIEKPEEAYDFGYEDYFYSTSLCLIEWPEKISELLPEETLRIKITEENDGSRTFELDAKV